VAIRPVPFILIRVACTARLRRGKKSMSLVTCNDSWIIYMACGAGDARLGLGGKLVVLDHLRIAALVTYETIGVSRLECLEQLRAQLRSECVHVIGPVRRDNRDRFLLLVIDDVRHVCVLELRSSLRE